MHLHAISSESRAKGFQSLAAQRRQALTAQCVALPDWPQDSNLAQWSSNSRNHVVQLLTDGGGGALGSLLGLRGRSLASKSEET
eukprot:7744461-Pyramimonas_sp.AAC.1